MTTATTNMTTAITNMTTATTITYASLQPDDYDALAALVGQALFLSGMREWIPMMGAENFRTVHVGCKLAAGMGTIPMGHWFGGRSVPAAGVTAVGVAPEFRGTGVGLAMIQRNLEELHAAGTPIASLYPATTTFYRRAGYERAVTRTIYEATPSALNCRDHTLELVAATPSDYDTLRALYTRRSQLSNGMLDRPLFMWQRMLEQPDKNPSAYIVMNNGQPEGYVIFWQTTREEPLNVRDICALTPAAGRRLLTALADHRTMVEAVRWMGAPADPLLFLMPEQQVKTHWQLDLVLRIVDVVGALQARGYPPEVTAKLHLDVQDDVLPHNNGRFVLRVADGQAQVEHGGAGRIRLHARGLASLYSSYLTARELRAAGALEGADADLARADLVFGGPRPWLPDMF